MYRLIVQHTDLLLDSIDARRDVEPYVQLLKDIQRVNVGTDLDFQRRYRNYWGMNAARLSESFLKGYFEFLEAAKLDPGVEVETAVRHIAGFPSHGNGRQSVQFSFGSKLVHMVRNKQPVYDSMIERFYFFPASRAGEAIDVKIGRLMQSYRFLEREFQRVLEHGLLAKPIEAFRAKFPAEQRYSDAKVVDTLIWKFVEVLGKGGIRSGSIAYG
jgi:hypothetical protein